MLSCHVLGSGVLLVVASCWFCKSASRQRELCTLQELTRLLPVMSKSKYIDNMLLQCMRRFLALKWAVNHYYLAYDISLSFRSEHLTIHGFLTSHPPQHPLCKLCHPWLRIVSHSVIRLRMRCFGCRPQREDSFRCRIEFTSVADVFVPHGFFFFRHSIVGSNIRMWTSN